MSSGAADNAVAALGGRTLKSLTKTVAARSSETLAFPLRPRQRLSLWFRTEGHDVAFGAFIRTGGETVELRATGRVESHVLPQFFEAFSGEERATLALHFENSYSLLRSKVVHLTVCVEDVPPTGSSAASMVVTRAGAALLRRLRDRDGIMEVDFHGGGKGFVHTSTSPVVPAGLFASTFELDAAVAVLRSAEAAARAAAAGARADGPGTAGSARPRAGGSGGQSALGALADASASAARGASSIVSSAAASAAAVVASASAAPVSLLASWLDDDASASASASPAASAVAAALLARASPLLARRFLEHFGWDRAAASRAMLDAARWRAAAAPWSDRAADLSPALARAPCFWGGHDPDGRPVLVVRMAGPAAAGRADDGAGADVTSRVRAFAWALEAAAGNGILRTHRAAASGGAIPVSRGAIALVVDFTGAPAQPTDFLRRAAALLLLRYPGAVARCLVLDAPPAVVALWGTLRSILPPWVAAAVELCRGTSTEEGIAALRSRLGEGPTRAVLASYPDCGELDRLEGAAGRSAAAAEGAGGRGWGSDGASLQAQGAWGAAGEAEAAMAARAEAVATARVRDARSLAWITAQAAEADACAACAASRCAEPAAGAAPAAPAETVLSPPTAAQPPRPPDAGEDEDSDILMAAEVGLAGEQMRAGAPAVPGAVALRRGAPAAQPSPAGSEGVEVVDWAAAVAGQAPAGEAVGALTPPDALSETGPGEHDDDDGLTI